MTKEGRVLSPLDMSIQENKQLRWAWVVLFEVPEKGYCILLQALPTTSRRRQPQGLHEHDLPRKGGAQTIQTRLVDLAGDQEGDSEGRWRFECHQHLDSIRISREDESSHHLQRKCAE